MEARLERETDALLAAWRSKSKADLRDGLVSGLQDPRLSLQRVLMRHFFTNELWPGRFEDLMVAELAHVCRLNLEYATGRSPSEPALNRFGRIWRAALDPIPAGRLSVLEIACGSANDYRCLDSYGLARHLDYTGLDLNRQNIANACEMFPDARFEQGNVFELGADGERFDYVFVADLFEHLSFHAIGVAVERVCAVATKSVVINFFRMCDAVEHQYRAVPERQYYWHTLSMTEMTRLFARHAMHVDVVRMADHVGPDFDFAAHYEHRATFFVAMGHGGGKIRRAGTGA